MLQLINYQPFYPLNTMNYFTDTAFNGLQSVTPIVYNDALVSTTGKISSDCYSVCTILCHDLTESGLILCHIRQGLLAQETM